MLLVGESAVAEFNAVADRHIEVGGRGLLCSPPPKIGDSERGNLKVLAANTGECVQCTQHCNRSGVGWQDSGERSGENGFGGD